MNVQMETSQGQRQEYQVHFNLHSQRTLKCHSIPKTAMTDENQSMVGICKYLIVPSTEKQKEFHNTH